MESIHCSARRYAYATCASGLLGSDEADNVNIVADFHNTYITIWMQIELQERER